MDIKLKNLEYAFDEDGNTTNISVSFNGYQDRQSISAVVLLEAADLPEGKGYDDLTKKDITSLGRAKLSNLVAVQDK